MENKEKVLMTGIKPTGIITLGNYLGAIKQMVQNQGKYEKSYMFIADMHAITVTQDPKELKENIKKLVALYLACGIDKDKNIIFLQSENPYHASISWLLECTAYFGETSRMIQFKEKSKKSQNFTVGLFTYPILMAADILIYDSNYVPVGIDQKQHVELTRDLAERFNKKYNNILVLPEPLITKEGTKIMDLKNPEVKMSKSAENKNGVIDMLEDIEAIRKKIMKAETDSDALVKYDPENKKGISNLINIYKAIENKTIEEIEAEFKNKSYKEFKESVATSVCDHIKKIQEKYNEIINSNIIDEVLESGKEKTLKIAEKKYYEMKNSMGLSR